MNFTTKENKAGCKHDHSGLIVENIVENGSTLPNVV
ncbi:hypothetical protein EYZ11_010672 [Aspergillus tanneri]|uniref:Uncharacterized protein n=1 Tax=Aspergillus tanneri TaxID=1220188 RepID=A0A4S3JA52_9EURO|nr:hypothetical protein EYZ11_010672 [Aspergillus tanneri]